MDHAEFDSVSWGSAAGNGDDPRPTSSRPEAGEDEAVSDGQQRMQPNNHPTTPLMADDPDPLDLAGIGAGRLDCKVDSPQKENEGTKDGFISYRVTTDTNVPSFQTPNVIVRRRFTDFVFLYKTLFREYPACAVPPLPEKHKMEYVRGDRFGPDFTNRRAHSLDRFLKRLSLHPILRRSTLLVIFLESPDWNAHMRMRPSSNTRGAAGGPQLSPTDPASPNNTSSSGVFDSLTDTFLNAFSKVHKPDKRFIEVLDRSNKLDEDLSHVEKVISRVARRQADLETDYADLSVQFRKLVNLEPGCESALQRFATRVEGSSAGWRQLKEHTDQNYLGSLRDLQSYIVAIKSLLRVREQRQLDFEALTDYRNKAASDRDSLASSHPGLSHGHTQGSSASSTHHPYHPSTTLSSSSSTATGGVTGFLRNKIEDVRGVDPESSRRERVRRLELKIEDLSSEVEQAKLLTEAFDEEVVREVADFERIKAVEMRSTLGELAQHNIDFYRGVRSSWEGFVEEMEKELQRGDGVEA